MKTHSKRLLSILLSVAMVLSLLVVPAAAETEEAPMGEEAVYVEAAPVVDAAPARLSAGEGETEGGDATADTVTENTVYQLSKKGHAFNQGTTYPTSAAEVPAGISFDSGFGYSSDHGPKGTGVMTVKLPADKYATLTVTTCAYGLGGTPTASVGDVSVRDVSTEPNKDGKKESNDAGKVITILNAKGTTEITFSTDVYVHGLTVSKFTDAPRVPLAIGKGHDFTTSDSSKNKEGTLYTQQVSVIEEDRFEGLLMHNVKYHGTTYGTALGTSASIDVITPGDCNIEVDVGYAWSLQLGDDADTLTTKGASDPDTTVVFHYQGSAGDTVAIKAMGSSYIKGVRVKALTMPPELALEPKDGVIVRADETVDVTATVKNATLGTVSAPSADSNVATTTVDGGKISITGVAAGKTTVNVSAAYTDPKDGTSSEPVTGTIPVRVLPATMGTVEAGTYSFQGSGAEDAYYTDGLEWTGAWNLAAGNGHGPTKGTEMIVHLPAGKRAKLTVATCCFGGGENVTMASSVGTVTKAKAETAEDTNNNKFGNVFTVTEAKGDVKLTFGGGQVYVHSLEVSFIEPCDTAGCILDKGHEGDHNVLAQYAGGKIDFQKMVADGETAPTPTEGVSFGDGVTLPANTHGAQTSKETAIVINLKETALVTVNGCQYGKLNNATATGANGDITMPTPWYTDPQYVFEDVPAGLFTLTLPKGVWVHNIEVSYDASAKKAAFWVPEDCVSAEVGATVPAVEVLTRFTEDKATVTQATGTDVATIAADANGKITVTPIKEGEATATVSLAGTDQTQTFTALVWAKGKVHTEWKLQTGKWATKEKVTIQKTTGTLRGLEIDATAGGAKFDGTMLGNGNGVQSNQGTIVKVPVSVPAGHVAKVTVTSKTANTITVDGVANTKAGEAEEYTCAGTDDVVTIVSTAKAYLGDIKVEYVEGEAKASLSLDKTSVELQMVKKPTATVTATVYGSKAAVEATSSDDKIVTAAVGEDGKTITLTAVAANGEEAATATVTVKVAGTTNEEATKTISVTVKPQGPKDYIFNGGKGIIDFAEYGNDGSGEKVFDIPGLDTHGNISQPGDRHGLQEPGSGAGVAGDTTTGEIKVTVSFPEDHTSDINFITCRYGAGTKVEMTTEPAYEVKKEETAVDQDVGLKFTVLGVKGDVTFTFAVPGEKAAMWIHSLEVIPGAVKEDNRQIDVWDLTGQVATGEGIRNNIAPMDWKGHAVDGILSGGTEFTKGDFTYKHNTNDRIYSSADNAAEFGAQAPGYGKYTFEDGYDAGGGIYNNGAGSESNRYMMVANVFPNDKLVIYGGTASGSVEFTVMGQGGAAAQTQVFAMNDQGYAKMEFVAQYEGAYKIFGGTGKAMYQRVMRYPGVPVSGTITLPADYNGPANYGIKFVNMTTEAVTEVEVKDNKFSTVLAPGYEYNAILAGAPGWGFTKETKRMTTELNGGVGENPNTTHDMTVEAKQTYVFSGKLAGFADGYDLKDLSIKAMADKTSGSDNVTLDIDKTAKTFTGNLDPEVLYTLEMTGADDYAIETPKTVSSEGAAVTQDIKVALKPLHTASGKFLGLEGGAKVTELKLTYLNEKGKPEANGKYTYSATVTADGYTAQLRDGAYGVTATVSDGKHSTKTHVVVDGKDAVKDLLFVSSNAKPAVDKVKDVYVGCPDKSPNFETVNAALDAISRMGITSEADRVTVHIAPGTYREQIIIETPYVTFVNTTPGKQVLLTWYYGIGYKYYSAGGQGSASKGLYDPEFAFDKFEKNAVDRWGCTVRVQAEGFRAENITFENSFNRYITDEEIADGVESTGETIKVARNYSTDVKSKAATERAAALVVEAQASKTEFKGCTFLSSQDTIYTSGTGYFKNCLIEGMTDYIFGQESSRYIFDGCELRFKGYSANPLGGYITAPRTDAGQVGYMFRNCAITANSDKDVTVPAGFFGRPWGQDANVFFVNTKLEKADLIVDTGWSDWSGGASAAGAKYAEYNTTLMDGTAVNTSKRVAGTVKTEADAKAMNDMTKYYGSWVPFYYVEEEANVAFKTAPYLTNNGDLNKPYPGNTLTVNYSLGEANDQNDASTIQWYTVKDGTETLVKTSVATASRSYKIQSEDVGAQIKVVVTPATISGNKGESASVTTDAKVNEGYQDPDSTVDPSLGDGVNIFLAGDSTVKDYSAKGMYNSGKSTNAGSWGEFLQNYFGEGVTVVNYANGGRSTRNFINEGTLDKIAKNIKKGDYLFIQFGHNDCANDEKYIVDRYVPLGTPDASGKYPVTEGKKTADVPAADVEKYGNEWYSWKSGGTYKWFLKQYIDVAKEAGAIPVLVTPVARMYYSEDGKINPHHDASLVPGTEETTKQSNTNKSNTYCEAVRQLAQEEGVLLIDAYALTEEMFVDAWNACEGTNKALYGEQSMDVGDKTHSNKLGGMIEAGLVAQAIQGMGLNISKAVKAPAKALAESPKGETVFSVDAEGKLTAYDMLSKPTYSETAPYWMGYGQKLFDAIAAKAGKPSEPVDKDALTAAVAEAKKAVKGIYVVEDDVTAADVKQGKKFITKTDKKALDDAIAAAEAVLADANATEAQMAKAKADLDKALAGIQTGTKSTGGTTPPASSGGRPTGGGATTQPTTTVVKDPNGNTAKKTTNSNGDVVIVVTDKNGEVLAEINLPASIAAPKTKFKDVPDNHWAAKSINNMASLGMVKGVAEDTYDMTSPMTRGAIATVLFRLANGKGGKTTSFADVAADAWYTDAVGWAVASGVVNGYSETAFGPDDSITRQQLAVMITRLMKLAGVDTAAKTDKLDAFVDGAATDDWAKESVAWCVENGIIKGKGNDVLDPTAAVSRAEAAAMLDRAIEALR